MYEKRSVQSSLSDLEKTNANLFSRERPNEVEIHGYILLMNNVLRTKVSAKSARAKVLGTTVVGLFLYILGGEATTLRPKARLNGGREVTLRK